MLQDCRLSTAVLDGMKRGSMPSADKLIIIAEYLEVSLYYLMGITNNPALNKTEATEEEKIASKIFTLTADQRRIVETYIDFVQAHQG